MKITESMVNGNEAAIQESCYSIPANNMSGGSHVSRGTFGGAESEISGGSAPPLPSPASAGAALVSPETLSRHSSPPPLPPHPSHQLPAPSCSSHRVHLESPLRLSSPPSMNLGGSLSLQPVLYGPAGGGPAHAPLPPARRPSRPSAAIQHMHVISASDALATTLSALYGKLLVVMGVAFPMAEVISTYIPPSFYEGFYLYLYIGSMVFLLYMYAALVRDRSRSAADNAVVAKSESSSSPSESDSCSSRTERSTATAAHALPQLSVKRLSLGFALATRTHHYGSFYLRMGAVAFGIGSMIYSGLEFGQYWELERNTNCHNVLLALTPA
ncbi:hypothetical protein O3G_MSEX013305, partial [Manduca sexta]